MKIVTTFGYAYSVTDRNYKRLMEDIAKDSSIDMNNYGKPLGHTVNITDMTSEQAKEELESLKQ